MRIHKMIFLAMTAMIFFGLLSACAGIEPSTVKPAEHSLTVNGTGRVMLVPDVAYITVGVHTEAESVGQALTQNTAQSQKIRDVLVAQGVDAKDIQTTNFNVYPTTVNGPDGSIIGTKYVVDNSVYITVRDLSKMGKILEQVVSSGANNINGIQFDVLDKTAALTQARKLAVDDARKQADELAAAAGIKLGPVLYMGVSNTVPSPMYASAMKGGLAAGGGGGAPVPVAAGELLIQVDVNITYQIK